MKFSFEIVPRSHQAFDDQYSFVTTLGESISMINVPDIQRFDIRSWETEKKLTETNINLFLTLEQLTFQ